MRPSEIAARHFNPASTETLPVREGLLIRRSPKALVTRTEEASSRASWEGSRITWPTASVTDFLTDKTCKEYFPFQDSV